MCNHRIWQDRRHTLQTTGKKGLSHVSGVEMVVLRYTALIGRERSRDILGHAPGQGQDHLAYRTKVEI